MAIRETWEEILTRQKAAAQAEKDKISSGLNSIIEVQTEIKEAEHLGNSILYGTLYGILYYWLGK